LRLKPQIFQTIAPYPMTTVACRNLFRSKHALLRRLLPLAPWFAPSRFVAPPQSWRTSAGPQARFSTSSRHPELPPQNPPQPKLEPRLSLTFTCAVDGCGQRTSHQFTKRAYERGLVIIQCPHCKNRHLVADHIGWFKETQGTGDGKLKNVEDFMRAKGEQVQRGRLESDGSTVLEYVEN